MYWTEVNFGKYKGKTLPQIVLSDPDYFFWAIEENVFSRYPSLDSAASDLARKASRIKVPSNHVVEYFIHPGVGKLAAVEIVPEDRPPHLGASKTFRRPFFDLSAPRSIANYDKTGGKVLISAFKALFLGSSDARPTKKRCEEFFENSSHFV